MKHTFLKLVPLECDFEIKRKNRQQEKINPIREEIL
jgi:hypothetical protein